MNHKIKQFRLRRIFAFLAAWMLLALPVSAAEYVCTATIPVEVEVTGESLPSGVDSRLVFVSDDAGNPVPEQTDIAVKDSQAVSFGPVSYTEPGDYTYRIYQEKGSAYDVVYDESVYSVTVRVVNGKGGGLKAEIWAVKDGGQNKTDKIKFTNVYKAPSKPEPEAPKTGDSGQPAFWGDIMMLSLLAMVIAGSFRKKDGGR